MLNKISIQEKNKPTKFHEEAEQSGLTTLVVEWFGCAAQNHGATADKGIRPQFRLLEKKDP